MGLLRKALALGKVAVYRGSHPYRGWQNGALSITVQHILPRREVWTVHHRNLSQLSNHSSQRVPQTEIKTSAPVGNWSQCRLSPQTLRSEGGYMLTLVPFATVQTLGSNIASPSPVFAWAKNWLLAPWVSFY
jgi:hypothetical protein